MLQYSFFRFFLSEAKANPLEGTSHTYFFLYIKLAYVINTQAETMNQRK